MKVKLSKPTCHPVWHFPVSGRATRRQLSSRPAIPFVHYFFFLGGRLVVRQLSRQQPQRLVPQRRAPLLRRRRQLVHVDGVQLLAQEDRHEDEAADQRAHRQVITPSLSATDDRATTTHNVVV